MFHLCFFLIFQSCCLNYSLISCCIFEAPLTGHIPAAHISYFIAASHHEEGFYLRVIASLIFLESGGETFLCPG